MANDSTNEDDAYITIKDLDPATEVDGADILYKQESDGTDKSVTAALIKDYCTPPMANANEAGLVSITSQVLKGRKEFQNGVAITGKTSVGSFAAARCDTAADTQNKEIEITGYTLEVGDIIGVTFTYANTYGDSTLDTPTYPKLVINSQYELQIQNGGKTVGTGAWQAEDYLEMRVISTSAVEILNSDIRQSVSGTSGYTIYRNGKYGEYHQEFTKTTGTDGLVWGTHIDGFVPCTVKVITSTSYNVFFRIIKAKSSETFGIQFILEKSATSTEVLASTSLNFIVYYRQDN